MASQDQEYYRKRAEAEPLLALEARDAAAAAAHNALAVLYDAHLAPVAPDGDQSGQPT